MSEEQKQAVMVAEPNMPVINMPTLSGGSVFASSSSFELALRMADALANSSMIPDQYRTEYLGSDKKWVKNPDAVGNCMIALELSLRLRCSVLAIFQNVDMVKGQPGLRGSFCAALIQSCGLFTDIDYEWKGEQGSDDWGCRMTAYRIADGKRLEGTWVDWKLVKGEGWNAKDGSKWKTMPAQMFVYRASSFFSRQWAPHVTNGMHTTEELEDFVVDVPMTVARLASSEDLNRQLDDQNKKSDPPKRGRKPKVVESPEESKPEEPQETPESEPVSEAPKEADQAPDQTELSME